MGRLLLRCLLFGLPYAAVGQVTLHIGSYPADTPRGSAMYLAGTLNQWAVNDPSLRFRPDSLGRLTLTIASPPDTFEYLISRGCHASVEAAAGGEPMANRLYVGSQGPEVVIQVARWRDRVPPRERVSTATRRVSYAPTSIEMPQLGRRRTIRIYFPPNYAQRQGFPVVYMLDGQNLFDATTAFSGEWGVDETLDELHRLKGTSVIVVGIYHGHQERLNEHSPWPNASRQGGYGRELAQFIVRDLKPYMDNHFRTLPGQEHTAIMGSGMGGLMALYMALEYPQVFGRAGVFSPELGWSPRAFEMIRDFRKRRFQKIYLVAGGREPDPMLPNVNRAYEMLRGVGFAENEVMLTIPPDGRHSEWFWGREFGGALEWLFGL